MVSGFSDYRPPVGMANENCRSVLRCKSSLGNCYVVLQPPLEHLVQNQVGRF